MFVEARITEWTMALSQIEVPAVDGFQVRFVAIKQMALVIVSCRDEAGRNDQVGVETADGTRAHNVLVEADAHATVGAPRSNAFQAKHMRTALEKPKLRAFFGRSFKTDTTSFISRLLNTRQEQKPAEASRLVLLNASLVETAHHLPAPTRSAQLAVVVFAIRICAVTSEEVLFAKSFRFNRQCSKVLIGGCE